MTYVGLKRTLKKDQRGKLPEWGGWFLRKERNHNPRESDVIMFYNNSLTGVNFEMTDLYENVKRRKDFQIN